MTRKFLLLALLTVAAALFFGLGLGRYLSLDTLDAQHAMLVYGHARHPVAFTLGFVALLSAALALSIPGSLMTMAIAGGAIFGLIPGTLLVLTGVVLGDTLAMLIARYLLADWVRARFTGPFERIDRGIAQHGALYLLSLRLMAVVPFFVVNLAMGLTRMPVRVFAPVSLVGLIPATLLHVNVGTQLSRVQHAGDLLSPGMLLSFAGLALLPLVLTRLLRDWAGVQASSAASPIATAPIGPAIAPSPGGPISASMSSPANEP